MSTSKRFMVFVPLVSIFVALSLSAMAQEPPKKPAAKAPAVQPRGQVKPGPMAGPHPGPRGPGMAGMHHRVDPHHFDRAAWGLGRAYPYGCRWGRCGYWWWADGYWYFYDQQFAGSPEVVSEVAYDEQGNLVPVEAAPPPAVGYAPPPPPVGYMPPPPPPPPPGQDAVGGAVGGAVLGGILGGVLTGRPGGAVAGAIVGGATGAAIGAEAQRRNGYYLWQGACYYRYPTGEYAAVDPRYCN